MWLFHIIVFVRMIVLKVFLFTKSNFCFLVRYGEPRGAGPGGARVPDALPGRVPRLSARAHALVLEEGPGGEADV